MVFTENGADFKGLSVNQEHEEHQEEIRITRRKNGDDTLNSGAIGNNGRNRDAQMLRRDAQVTELLNSAADYQAKIDGIHNDIRKIEKQIDDLSEVKSALTSGKTPTDNNPEAKRLKEQFRKDHGFEIDWMNAEHRLWANQYIETRADELNRQRDAKIEEGLSYQNEARERGFEINDRIEAAGTQVEKNEVAAQAIGHLNGEQQQAMRSDLAGNQNAERSTLEAAAIASGGDQVEANRLVETRSSQTVAEGAKIESLDDDMGFSSVGTSLASSLDDGAGFEAPDLGAVFAASAIGTVEPLGQTNEIQQVAKLEVPTGTGFA